MDNTTYHPLKVWQPDGTVKKTPSIACNEDHVGNLVQEKLIPQSEYYPELCRLYKSQLKQARKDSVEMQQKREAEFYKKNVWVLEYLSYMERLKRAYG